MQFGFVPGRSTTNAIFIVRQLQEKFWAVNKTLYMAFVDLISKLAPNTSKVSIARYNRTNTNTSYTYVLICIAFTLLTRINQVPWPLEAITATIMG